jgi:hypothetical protein
LQITQLLVGCGSSIQSIEKKMTGGAINSLTDWVLAEGFQESNLIVVFGSPDSKEGSKGARGLGL